MNTLSFDHGQVIFKQGDFSSTMFDILSGKVGICADYGSEREKLIAELGNEQLLGEMGMIEAYPRSATAVALEDATILAEITEKELSEYFADKPEKLLTIMKQLSQRLRTTTQNYVDACRAIYENNEAEENGAEKSQELQNKLQEISDAYVGMPHE